MIALAVHGLAKAFGGVQALAGVDFALRQGERVALIGPNGAGKSTCFHILGGQLKPDAGHVEVFGERLPAGRPHAVWRAGVGRTFQMAAVFASLSLADNVTAALLAVDNHSLALLWRADRAWRQRAISLLAQVGMAEQADRQAATLAYGDLKRLELAIALAASPRLLLMDEPTAGMAPAERGELMRLVVRLAAERNLTVLFTEHDMDVVFAYADRLLVLHRGRLIAAGPPEAVRADERVQEVYLGRPLSTGATEDGRLGYDI
jgi:branched-chain amino acid transport system ATP-binding protein